MSGAGQATINIKDNVSDELLDMSGLKVNGAVNINECNNKLKLLDEYLKSAPIENIVLLSKGNNPKDNKVVKDNFLRFYGVQQIVKKELKKLNKIEEQIRQIEFMLSN